MPSEQKMQFFTPELYVRYNSPDDNGALAADAEWEAAIQRYRQYLAELHEKMPSAVVELSKLCLHDGEILHRQEQQDPLNLRYPEEFPAAPRFWHLWYGLATLAVRLENELVTLFYFLSDHIRELPPPENWSFSKQREHWLYDEVHRGRDDSGTFLHLILLSSGVVLTIPFDAVSISRFSLTPVVLFPRIRVPAVASPATRQPPGLLASDLRPPTCSRHALPDLPATRHAPPATISVPAVADQLGRSQTEVGHPARLFCSPLSPLYSLRRSRRHLACTVAGVRADVPRHPAAVWFVRRSKASSTGWTSTRRARTEAGLLLAPTAEEIQDARAAYERGDGANAGLVDQVSFQLMRRLGITEAFTNDRHFQAAGFTVLF